ncbi:MAG TPA: cytochrome P450 [Pseudonocardiaceae bacterium]|nr:cytochrome P450 [Pseudonocardiaceae bacterium]
MTATRVMLRLRGEQAGAWLLARTGDPLAGLTQRGGQRDPYPIYERIRARGTISRSRTGMWVSTSHELATGVLRDRRFRVRNGADRVSGGLGELDPGMDDSLVDMEPPEHTRLRRLVAPAFGRNRVEGQRVVAEKLIERLLDQAASKGTFDLMSEVALPLPVGIISGLLGVPDTDSARFAHYGRMISRLLDGIRTVRQAREVRGAVDELRSLLTQVVLARRAEPADDLISALLVESDDPLSTKEIVALGLQLLIAGFETTTHLIGNGVGALLADPDQWSALHADPALASRAVEETLRYDPPVQLTQRIARENVELNGHELTTGDQLIVGLAGANRDPAVFADPHRFDLHRADAGEHLGFSGGHHYCLGAPLARLEGEIAFAELARRFPRLRPAGPAVQRPSTVLRGKLSFPVSVS